MDYKPTSPFLARLRDRITLNEIPFSERGSRLLIFRNPARLNIRLAERWAKWENELGDYRHRASIVDDLALTDDNGAPLDFQLTAYPHALCFETRVGTFALTFADEETLYLQLPASRCGIALRVFAANGHTDRRGGEFKADPAHRFTHRNIAYTTNARILSNRIESDTNGYLRVTLQVSADAESAITLNITPRLGLNRTVPRSDSVLRVAEQRWHAWFAAAPKVDEKYVDQ